MIIELQIASVFHPKVPPSEKNLGGDRWEVPDGTGVADVLEMLKLDEVPTILVVNGRQENKNTKLKEGDVLTIFSAISGG